MDSYGHPLPKVVLHQYVQDFSSGSDVDRSTDKLTDLHGAASFDGVVAKESVMGELLGCARQVFTSGAHASCGSYSDITVSNNTLIETARSEQKVKGQRGQRSIKLTMEPCPSGDYWQCSASMKANRQPLSNQP
jgi:hypothetical protein